MRWSWIDRIVHFEPEKRMIAVKNVSLGEDHLHDHFAADALRDKRVVMPASLIIEGMAQTSGLLAGSVSGFCEKVILAKITLARLDDEAMPGDQLVYDSELDRYDTAGASCRGTILVRRPFRGGPVERPFGEINLLFSHADTNRSGMTFPEENFVFSDNFKGILTAAGLDHLVLNGM